MPRNGMVRALVGAAALLFATAWSASAQITTGTVSGNVTDPQGVVPGATVMLVNEAQGTKIGPQVTDKDGNYTFAYVAPGTYTVTVELQGYKTASRKGVQVVGGDKVAVPSTLLQPGGVSESVEVRADTAVLQAASGERSDVVQQQQLESLPVANRGFRDLVNLLPGVNPGGGGGAQSGRIGGGGQDLVMIDGIAIMDSGNNGLLSGQGSPSLNVPVDAISEVRLETSGYQAEFGRSSGLQISAITKSGTNRFHGSAYEISNNSKWNQNSWTNIQNGTAKSRSKSNSYGYTIGGPVGKPGGNNKLFFFYAQQFNPTLSGGSTTNIRVPTTLERQGNFSQSTDEKGNPLAVNGVTYLYDATLGSKSGCSSASKTTSTCFGGGSGIVPLNRLYGPTVAWLNEYPLPTCGDSGLGLASCPAGQNFNYTAVTPVLHNLGWTPTMRGDYQVTPGLRISAKATLNSARVLTNPGSVPGLTDTQGHFPHAYNVSGTVNYSLNPTTFLETTYGYVQNQLGTPSVSQYSNRNNVTCSAELAGTLPLGVTSGLTSAQIGQIPNCNLGAISFPLSNNQIMDSRYYEFNGNIQTGVPFLDPTTGLISLPPTVAWNGASGTTNHLSSVPPSIGYPGFMNINRIQDLTASVTKVMGRHTMKAGFSFEHSYKAQNQGAGPSFQGALNFGDDSNNPLETGFPFTNEILGVYQTYGQGSQFVEGSFIYNAFEPYIQDNWKVNRKLTLDMGLRFVHQGPQYDQFGQSSNFFPDQWTLASAPQLYKAGCSTALNASGLCTSANRVAINPVTGLSLGAGTAGLVGAAVPNSGNFADGMVQAGKGIPLTAYLWPGMVYAPRFGLAYDVSGNQKLIVRGNLGLFYDRPDGNTVFGTVANPPLASSITNQWASLAGGGSTISSGPVSTIGVYQYNSNVPSDTQWSAGIQMALPWASSLGVAYVGHHAWNVLAAQQNGNGVNLNAIDLGTDFLASSLDPAPTSAGQLLPDNMVRAFRGYSAINVQEAIWNRTFHSLQLDFTRRFRNGFSFQVADTVTLNDTGTTGMPGGDPQLRLVHAPDGSFSVAPTQAQALALFANQGITRNIMQNNFVYAIPKWEADGGVAKVLAMVVNDWQISGILRLDSGSPFDLNTPSYASGGGNQNLTGSSDYGARIVVNNLGAMGSGCSSNQFAQFTNNFNSTANVLGASTPIAGPVVGSQGLESGRNLFHNCINRTLDLSLSRTIRLGGGRQIQLRADAFNAPNAVIWTGSARTVNLTSPTNQTFTNSEILADGTVDPAHTKPNAANFGAVNAAAAARTVQLQIRFIF